MTEGKKEAPLPVYNPVDIDPQMVDSTMRRVGHGHRIGAFSLQNQDGQTITRTEVNGKVHVAEYFFTHCQSICPIMTDEMTRVHKKFKDNNDVKILSFTVDPKNDTIQRMKWYANKHEVKGNNWHFLTGDKMDLYNLARTSYFVLKPAEARNLGDAGSDFIHTNNFVLVDQQLRIRGYYDGTNSEEVDKLMVDIQKLLDE